MIGQQKTNLGGFKGFGFGAKPTGNAPGAQKTGGFGGMKLGGGVSRPGAPTKPPAQAKAKSSGVSALFKASMDDEEEQGATTAVPSWSKLTPEAAQAQKQAEALMAEDPSVFQYDEVLDDMKEEMGLETGPEKIRAEALTQKKRVGLHVPEGAQEVKTGTKRSAKYIEKVMLATDRRRVEQQIVEDRLLKKEKEARKDAEVFVTAGFKEELKRRKKFEDELEAQEVRDQINAAEKQENGAGFASMYRNLLNGGLASGRGGEKVKDIKAAREDLEEEQEVVKEEVKEEEEDEDKLKAELVPLVPKAEVKEEATSEGHGVQDVKADPDKKVDEREKREEKALSAKERYLLRKKGLAAPES
eukprot:gb/GFBE01061680.1/.p1 GENE.gb/GFBE01061680.1/~~gb/GFBE01061680.1/.p1  ORF type:complete len:358 (+),score=136.44 gb/GFBE01061680.1/:1-1074(+)